MHRPERAEERGGGGGLPSRHRGRGTRRGEEGRVLLRGEGRRR